MKYIIKNCPALTDQGKCYQGSVFMGTAFSECQERTGCVMKRIVNEYKKEKIIKCNIDGKEQILKAYHHTCIGDKILELLEIEVVDEM